MAITKIKSSGNFEKDGEKIFKVRPGEMTDDEINAREKTAAESAKKPMDTSFIDEPFHAGETIDFEVVPSKNDKRPEEMAAPVETKAEVKAEVNTVKNLPVSGNVSLEAGKSK